MAQSIRLLALVVGSLLACNSNGEAAYDDAITRGDNAATATTDGGKAESGSSTPDTTTSAADSSTTVDTATSAPPLVLDVGAFPDAMTPKEAGCQSIDFLFVVDNSGSMNFQQMQLLNSFPGFIAGIEDSLQNVDSYHVGVVTSDNYDGNEPGCNELGDLVTRTAGNNASNAVCGPFASGLRFATNEDDLQTVFPCMARVGTSGSKVEQPVTATIAALDPAKAEPGECNEGFLRKNAILVVVIVTDDIPLALDMDDAHTHTDTTGWFDAVVAAKDGDVESLVVIGFVPWMDTSCTGHESPNLSGFIQKFGAQGVLASVCEPDYGPVFESTIATIQTTCDDFVPAG